MWNVECGMRNVELSASPMKNYSIKNYNILHSTFNIATGNNSTFNIQHCRRQQFNIQHSTFKKWTIQNSERAWKTLPHIIKV